MAIRHAVSRDQVRRAVWDEVERVGLRAFRPSVIVGDFSGCGSDRATIYRWVRAELKSGAPARALGRSLAAVGPVKAPELGEDAVVHLTRLRECADAAVAVMRAARGEDGAVKNPRILLAAADQLRQAVESAARVTREGVNSAAVTAFVAAVADQVRLAPPAVAHQIGRRLAEMGPTATSPR